MATDCMIVGFNDYSFDDYIEALEVGGKTGVSYRDSNLSFLTYEGTRLRALDVLNKHAASLKIEGAELNNSDFLWPVITYLGTYLNKRGISFDYVRLFHQDREKLKASLIQQDVRTVAITTTVYVTPQPIMEIVDFVRRYDPKATIVIGGPYLADLPKILDKAALAEHLEMLGADIYIFGAEGEETLVKLISALKSGAEYQHLDNIGYQTAAGFKVNTIVAEGNSLEENMVDYSLFDKKDIGEFVTVRTAKSCPFACAFCGFPERAGKYKYLPVEYVERELNAIRDIGGVSTITFIDDTFNVPKGRFKDMLRMMIKNNYQFRWNSYLRSDHVDDEALELMAASGCDGVFLGVESGSTDILINMAKNSRPEHYRRVIKKCRELGIVTYASVIIGFPGEDRRTVQESIDFLNDAKPDFFRAQVWYADPITPIYKKGQDYDLSGQAFQWQHRTMDSMEAAYYVEKMFLCVTGSTWLPQNGFEPWSLYYLQRKGMTLGKIHAYLEYFNDGLKQKLLSKNSPDVGRAAYQNMVSVLTGDALSIGSLRFEAQTLDSELVRWANYLKRLSQRTTAWGADTTRELPSFSRVFSTSSDVSLAQLLEHCMAVTGTFDGLNVVVDCTSQPKAGVPIPYVSAPMLEGVEAPSTDQKFDALSSLPGLYLLRDYHAGVDLCGVGLTEIPLGCVMLMQGEEQSAEDVETYYLNNVAAYHKSLGLIVVDQGNARVTLHLPKLYLDDPQWRTLTEWREMPVLSTESTVAAMAAPCFSFE